MITLSVVCTLLLIASITMCSIAAVRCLGQMTGKIKKNKDSLLTPMQNLTLWCFFSIIPLFLPAYWCEVLPEGEHWLEHGIKTFLLSVHNTLRTFIMDGDFTDIQKTSDIMPEWLGIAYTIYSALMFVAAPLITAGFVLSFFRGLIFRIKFALSRNADLFFISELNEDSIYLAQNIMSGCELSEDIMQREKDPSYIPRKRKRLVIFFDVYEQNEEDNSELLSRARDMGAIWFQKDITELLPHPNPDCYRKYYFLGENEDENIHQSLRVLEKLRGNDDYDNDKTQLYVFSSTVESELLLNNAPFGKMKVRRINGFRNLILDAMIRNPIFDYVVEGDRKSEPYCLEKNELISILIVGMGKYGKELLKTLTWVGQMIGYHLRIHVIDRDDRCEELLKASCGEIMAYNDALQTRLKSGKGFLVGDARYEIYVHGGVPINSIKFTEVLKEIGEVSLAYCTLGDDELNIETAVSIHTFFGRMQSIGERTTIPTIFSIVYNSRKNEALSANKGVEQSPETAPTLSDGELPASTGKRPPRSKKNGVFEKGEPCLKDFAGTPYDIHFIGNRRLRYTMEIIEQPHLERKALECHLMWSGTDPAKIQADTEMFNRFEYYRRSSLANALHDELRAGLGIVLKENAKDIPPFVLDEEGHLFDTVFSDLDPDPDRTDNFTLLEQYNLSLDVLEHCRWDAFIRSEGYGYPRRDTDPGPEEDVVLTDEMREELKKGYPFPKSDMFKIHPALVPFHMLPGSIKKLDNIVNRKGKGKQ